MSVSSRCGVAIFNILGLAMMLLSMVSAGLLWYWSTQFHTLGVVMPGSEIGEPASN